MLRSSLCDYSNAYILVKGTITAISTAAQDQQCNGTNKEVLFLSCAPFTNCIGKINNKQVDDAYSINVVMSIYNLIEYSDNYLKKSGILWQYCRDELTLVNDGTIASFTTDNATNSFNSKQKTTLKTGDDGTKKVKKTIPLKYLSNFWRTLEMPLINCEINLDLN